VNTTNEPRLELSVIAPCYNEEKNVRELARRTLLALEADGIDGELVLVDDGSQDGTARAIRELMQQHPGRVRGLFHANNKGIAAGWRTGVEGARGKYVTIIDSDLQYQPEDVGRLYRTLIDHTVDVVQGWRSAVGRERGTRYNISRAYNSMLNATFGMNLRDNKSGFLCSSREVMADLLTYKGKYFYWQSFVMVAAHAKGYSYKEVETLFEPRRQGVSFLDGTTTKASLRSLYDISRAAFEYRVSAQPRDLSDQFLRTHVVEAPRALSPAAHPARWRAMMASFNRSRSPLSSDVQHVYEALNKTQWLSASALRDFQDEKLRRLIRHCYRHVPYYRRWMQRANLRPEDIHGQLDLHKLPVLSKNDVRKNLYFDITADNMDRAEVERITTSGSTGEPLVVFADRRQLEFRWAASLRARELAGYRFGDPSVKFWDQALGSSQAQRRREKLQAWLINRTLIPSFEMSEDKLEQLVKSLSAKGPALIEGDAEVLDFVARYIKGSLGTLGFRPLAMISNGQTLTSQSRELIESAFGCQVFDGYTSRELGGIAHECSAHAGHHVVSEGYIVEILVDGRPANAGETGDLVITDLNNYAMPLVRYQLGDRATLLEEAPCACGRSSPRIGAIQGRAQSIIRGTGGRFVPGTFFDQVMKDYEYAIRQFRIVQREPGAVQLELVKAGRFSSDVMDTVQQIVRRHLGEKLRIDLQFVDSIGAGELNAPGGSPTVIAVDFKLKTPRAVS
jgi:phenylacetate-CoA ligase